MRLRRLVLQFLLVTIFTLFATPYSLAQIPPVGSTTSTPIPGAGHDYLGGVNETVNPANGSVSIRIPVIMPPGRGITLPFTFAYDSNGVNYVKLNSTSGQWWPLSATVSMGGWSDSVPFVNYFLETWTTLPDGAPRPTTCYSTINFAFQDAKGNRHNLDLSNNSFANNPDGACATGTNDWPPYFAGDVATQGGEGPILATIPTNWTTTPTVTVTDGDGTVFVFGTATTGALPSSVTDRNGNRITVNSTYTSHPTFSYVDTAGRTVLQDSGFSSSPETVTVSGLGAPYTLTWTALSTPTFTAPITILFNTCTLAWIIHDFASEKRKGALKD